MMRIWMIAVLLAVPAVAIADTSVYEGTAEQSQLGPRAARSFAFRIELTWSAGMLGQPWSGTTETVTLCPPGGPGLHHTCTSTLECTNHARFGIDDLHVTIGDGKRTLGEARTTYAIDTTTTATAAVGKTCTVQYPTVANPGSGTPFDVYIKISDTERFHLTLAPRAVLDPTSDPIAGYALSDVVLPPYPTQPQGSPAIDFTLERRPDLVHSWVASGWGGRVLLKRK